MTSKLMGTDIHNTTFQCIIITYNCHFALVFLDQAKNILPFNTFSGKS